MKIKNIVLTAAATMALGSCKKDTKAEEKVVEEAKKVEDKPKAEEKSARDRLKDKGYL